MKPTATFERPMFSQPTMWLLILLGFTFHACNNKKEEARNNTTDSTSDHRAVTSPGQADVTGTTQTAVNFYSYRIGIDTLITHEKRGYEKLIFTIRLDDLGNPTRMDLFYFEAKLAASGGDVGEYIFGTSITDNQVNLSTTNLMIGNNELVLNDYKDPITHKWLDFDYLILTPVDNAGYLGFNVTAFKKASSGSDTPVNLPSTSSRATKPSPPAKPAKVNSGNHTVEEQKEHVDN